MGNLTNSLFFSWEIFTVLLFKTGFWGMKGQKRGKWKATKITPLLIVRETKKPTKEWMKDEQSYPKRH